MEALVSGGSQPATRYQRAVAGPPVGLYAPVNGGSDVPAYQSIGDTPFQYLVPLLVGDRVIATYCVDAQTGSVQEASDSAARWSAIRDAINRVVDAADTDENRVRVVPGPWTSVVGLDPDGDLVAVFCDPRFGYDHPSVSESEAMGLSTIHGNQVYRGSEAEAAFWMAMPGRGLF